MSMPAVVLARGKVISLSMHRRHDAVEFSLPLSQSSLTRGSPLWLLIERDASADCLNESDTSEQDFKGRTVCWQGDDNMEAVRPEAHNEVLSKVKFLVSESRCKTGALGGDDDMQFLACKSSSSGSETIDTILCSFWFSTSSVA
ncbi:hypothetical protein FVE85_0121 [Porphyridium purpureum]|uniref:Uncharacterized protein n=1 Tax=Porphyridium purpureum TaxID=35688 RepID=A0A5J4Z007_PORPP|nr:hypothetical protein FVE85_0121 [Porphyridium purpureum]|eukprot:POR4105..scf208_2